MTGLVVGRCEFGPARSSAPFSASPRGEFKGVVERPKIPGMVRDALVRARATLRTASNDTIEDLAKPERANVLAQRIAEIDEVLSLMGENGL